MTLPQPSTTLPLPSTTLPPPSIHTSPAPRLPAAQVEVVAASGDILSVLGPSSFFGEMALLNPDGRAVASSKPNGIKPLLHIVTVCYC